MRAMVYWSLPAAALFTSVVSLLFVKSYNRGLVLGLGVVVTVCLLALAIVRTW